MLLQCVSVQRVTVLLYYIMLLQSGTILCYCSLFLCHCTVLCFYSTLLRHGTVLFYCSLVMQCSTVLCYYLMLLLSGTILVPCVTAACLCSVQLWSGTVLCYCSVLLQRSLWRDTVSCYSSTFKLLHLSDVRVSLTAGFLGVNCQVNMEICRPNATCLPGSGRTAHLDGQPSTSLTSCPQHVQVARSLLSYTRFICSLNDTGPYSIQFMFI